MPPKKIQGPDKNKDNAIKAIEKIAASPESGAELVKQLHDAHKMLDTAIKEAKTPEEDMTLRMALMDLQSLEKVLGEKGRKRKLTEKEKGALASLAGDLREKVASLSVIIDVVKFGQDFGKKLAERNRLAKGLSGQISNDGLSPQFVSSAEAVLKASGDLTKSYYEYYENLNRQFATEKIPTEIQAECDKMLQSLVDLEASDKLVKNSIEFAKLDKEFVKFNGDTGVAGFESLQSKFLDLSGSGLIDGLKAYADKILDQISWNINLKRSLTLAGVDEKSIAGTFKVLAESRGKFIEAGGTIHTSPDGIQRYLRPGGDPNSDWQLYKYRSITQQVIANSRKALGLPEQLILNAQNIISFADKFSNLKDKGFYRVDDKILRHGNPGTYSLQKDGSVIYTWPNGGKSKLSPGADPDKSWEPIDAKGKEATKNMIFEKTLETKGFYYSEDGKLRRAGYQGSYEIGKNNELVYTWPNGGKSELDGDIVNDKWKDLDEKAGIARRVATADNDVQVNIGPGQYVSLERARESGFAKPSEISDAEVMLNQFIAGQKAEMLKALTEGNELTEKQKFRIQQVGMLKTALDSIRTDIKTSRTLTEWDRQFFKEFSGTTDARVHRVNNMILDLDVVAEKIMNDPNKSIGSLVNLDVRQLLFNNGLSSTAPHLMDGNGRLREVTSRGELQGQYYGLVQFLRDKRDYAAAQNLIEENLLGPQFAAKRKELAESEEGKELARKARSDARGKIYKIASSYQDEWDKEGMTEEQQEAYIKELIDKETTLNLNKVVAKMNNGLPFADADGWDRSIMEFYKEMMGTGEWYNLADESWDMILDEVVKNAPLILISGGLAAAGRTALSAGATALVASARLTRFGLAATRIARGIEASGTLGKALYWGGNKALRLTGRASGLLAEGAIFETVYSGLQGENLFEGGWEKFPEWGKRILWSAATLGTFHVAGEVANKVNSVILKHITKFPDKSVRAVIQKLITTGSIETAAMLGIGAVQHYVENGDFKDWEGAHELFHALITVGALKVAGGGLQLAKKRFFPGKGPDGGGETGAKEREAWALKVREGYEKSGLKPGDEIVLRTEDGTVDAGWKIELDARNGQVIVSKKINGKFKARYVSKGKILADNPEGAVKNGKAEMTKEFLDWAKERLKEEHGLADDFFNGKSPEEVAEVMRVVAEFTAKFNKDGVFELPSGQDLLALYKANKDAFAIVATKLETLPLKLKDALEIYKDSPELMKALANRVPEFRKWLLAKVRERAKSDERLANELDAGLRASGEVIVDGLMKRVLSGPEGFESGLEMIRSMGRLTLSANQLLFVTSKLPESGGSRELFLKTCVAKMSGLQKLQLAEVLEGSAEGSVKAPSIEGVSSNFSNRFVDWIRAIVRDALPSRAEGSKAGAKPTEAFGKDVDLGTLKPAEDGARSLIFSMERPGEALDATSLESGWKTKTQAELCSAMAELGLPNELVNAALMMHDQLHPDLQKFVKIVVGKDKSGEFRPYTLVDIEGIRAESGLDFAAAKELLKQAGVIMPENILELAKLLNISPKEMADITGLRVDQLKDVSVTQLNSLPSVGIHTLLFFTVGPYGNLAYGAWNIWTWGPFKDWRQDRSAKKNQSKTDARLAALEAGGSGGSGGGVKALEGPKTRDARFHELTEVGTWGRHLVDILGNDWGKNLPSDQIESLRVAAEALREALELGRYKLPENPARKNVELIYDNRIKMLYYEMLSENNPADPSHLANLATAFDAYQKANLGSFDTANRAQVKLLANSLVEVTDAEVDAKMASRMRLPFVSPDFVRKGLKGKKIKEVRRAVSELAGGLEGDIERLRNLEIKLAFESANYRQAKALVDAPAESPANPKLPALKVFVSKYERMLATRDGLRDSVDGIVARIKRHPVLKGIGDALAAHPRLKWGLIISGIFLALGGSVGTYYWLTGKKSDESAEKAKPGEQPSVGEGIGAGQAEEEQRGADEAEHKTSTSRDDD